MSESGDNACSMAQTWIKNDGKTMPFKSFTGMLM
jgi:hypothetical protein